MLPELHSRSPLLYSYLKPISKQPNKIKDDFSDNFYDKTLYAKIILTKVVVSKAVKGGIESSNEDIDINIAGDSLKELSIKFAEFFIALGLEKKRNIYCSSKK